MSIVENNSALAEELIRYSRLCYERHLVGAAGGNISLRIPGRDAILVTASGMALRDVDRNNLVVVDGKGGILESPSGRAPSKETSFHLAIYKIKPDIQAVIHVHPAYATTYAALGMLIPTVTISARLKLKQCPLVREANPGSEDLLRNIIKAIGEAPVDATVLLLESHGIVAYSSELRQAFDDAELAEDTARIAFLYAQYAFRPCGEAVDLTLRLDENTPHYPSDPGFKKSWYLDFDAAGVRVSLLELGAHTGTHVDAPWHFLKDGADILGMPLGSFLGEAVAISLPKLPGENIDANDLSRADIREGDIVLFSTGWEQRAGTSDFFADEWPGLTSEALDVLISKRVKAVGGDFPSLDSPSSLKNGCPAHKKALSAGMPVFEALVNMHRLVGRRFFFIGLPLKLRSGEASPIRAIAILDINRDHEDGGICNGK